MAAGKRRGRGAPNHSDASYAALKARNDYLLTRAEAEALGVPYVSSVRT